jgi:hypothetical protein
MRNQNNINCCGINYKVINDPYTGKFKSAIIVNPYKNCELDNAPCNLYVLCNKLINTIQKPKIYGR